MEVSLRDRGRAIDEAKEHARAAKQSFASITFPSNATSEANKNQVDALVDKHLFDAISTWEKAEREAVDAMASYQAAVSLWQQWEARFDMVAKWAVTDGAETVVKVGCEKMENGGEVGQLIRKLEVCNV